MKDTLGRENRKIPDRNCNECGKLYRPRRLNSKYCSRECLWKNNGGHNKKAESWWINSNGYVEGKIWLPDGTQIRVKRSRFVMEGILGRPLKSDEDVHHKDGNKVNDTPSNLKLIEHGKHTTVSNLTRNYKHGYKLNLSEQQRKAKSLLAISRQLQKLGLAAISKSEKGE